MKVNILGTRYKIKKVDYTKDEYMQETQSGGYCDFKNKEIVLSNNLNDEPLYLRHELIHAIMFESGLEIGYSNVHTEEVVNWLAIMVPKINEIIEKGMKEVNK